MFGFIVREWDNGKYKFICYVFESDRSGKEVRESHQKWLKNERIMHFNPIYIHVLMLRRKLELIPLANGHNSKTSFCTI